MIRIHRHYIFAAAAAAIVASTSSAHAQLLLRRQPYCPPQKLVCPPAPVPSGQAMPPVEPGKDSPIVPPSADAPSPDGTGGNAQDQAAQNNQQQQNQNQNQQPQPNLNTPTTAQASGATRNAAPDMIGDFFGFTNTTPFNFQLGFDGGFGSGIGGSAFGNAVIDGATNSLVFISGDGVNPAVINGSIAFQAPGGGILVPDPVTSQLTNLDGFDSGNQVNGKYVAIPVGTQTVDFIDSSSILSNGQLYQIVELVEQVPLSTTETAQINIGRLKMSEGTSPVPRDRLIFNYSAFQNANLGANGVNVQRFAPGFEKTFRDGQASVQVQFPFASTLSSNQIINDASFGSNEVEFGDITLALKHVLYEEEGFLMSGGLQMTIPTSEDQKYFVRNNFNQDVREFARMKAESFHLMPFVGFVNQEDRWFFQGMMQFDFDANGNSVHFNRNPFSNTSTLDYQGKLTAASYIFLDVSLAYQIYRAEDMRGRGIASIAPMVELHYNRSLNASDSIAVISDAPLAPGAPLVQLGQFGSGAKTFESLNAVVGTSINMKGGGAWLIGYGMPLTTGQDREFDGELRVFYSYRFGGQTGQAGTLPAGNLRSGVF